MIFNELNAEAVWMYIWWSQLFQSRVGDNDIDRVEDEEEEFEIDSIEIHPDFNVGPYLNNDIAIITIGNRTNATSTNREESGINFGDYVGAACLPPESFW